jgi:hypothetical protein
VHATADPTVAPCLLFHDQSAIRDPNPLFKIQTTGNASVLLRLLVLSTATSAQHDLARLLTVLFLAAANLSGSEWL